MPPTRSWWKFLISAMFATLSLYLLLHARRWRCSFFASPLPWKSNPPSYPFGNMGGRPGRTARGGAFRRSPFRQYAFSSPLFLCHSFLFLYFPLPIVVKILHCKGWGPPEARYSLLDVFAVQGTPHVPVWK